MIWSTRRCEEASERTRQDSADGNHDDVGGVDVDDLKNDNDNKDEKRRKMTKITNHDDEMGCEDSCCGCDNGHDKAVEEAKKIT